MAVYKVPQDVEADDKLLGPFSFKQFVFLFLAVIGIGMAYALAQLALPLAIIPVPIILFFGALALPLRKDQPMEVYLAAIISFILKPKLRLWRPDGVERLIEVVAPQADETRYGKGYTQEEVQRRLSYLANIVDSRGWSVRNTDEPSTSMQAELYNEAQTVDDKFDDRGMVSQQIDNLLTKTNDERRQQLIENMRQPRPSPVQAQVQQPSPTAHQYSSFPQNGTESPAISSLYTPMSISPTTAPDENIKLTVNPYPTMSQSIIQPISDTSIPKPTNPATDTASHEVVSPAIIDLANNHNDLSIETLAREADRIKKKESEEVIISLR